MGNRFISVSRLTAPNDLVFSVENPDTYFWEEEVDKQSFIVKCTRSSKRASMFDYVIKKDGVIIAEGTKVTLIQVKKILFRYLKLNH